MILKRLLIGLLSAATMLAFVSMPTYADSDNGVSVVAGRQEATPERAPSPESMAVDALLVRPLGLAATVIGAGLFVVSLPFSAAGGNVGEAGSELVAAPAKMTFVRPLGRFKDE